MVRTGRQKRKAQVLLVNRLVEEECLQTLRIVIKKMDAQDHLECNEGGKREISLMVELHIRNEPPLRIHPRERMKIYRMWIPYLRSVNVFVVFVYSVYNMKFDSLNIFHICMIA